MKIIDAHHHLWQYDTKKHGWIDDTMSILRRDFMPQDLQKEIQSIGVDGCVAVQADTSEQETDFLIDLANQYSFIKGVVGWVDFTADVIEERLQHYAQFDPVRGMRHIVQDEPDDEFLLREDFQHGISQLRQFDLTYDILIFARHLPVAIQFAEQFPDQKFVLDHIAKPEIKQQKINDWEEGIRQLAQHPKMYCKLSGIITEADWDDWKSQDIIPYLDVVLDSFGPGRLMFGSDWPVCILAGSYKQVYELIYDYLQSLTKQEQAAIFGKNAIEFYNLT